tara:strand:- start:1002 stop:1172 length:171 start_codon:yes stop_codon:yes gene_type:complete
MIKKIKILLLLVCTLFFFGCSSISADSTINGWLPSAPITSYNEEIKRDYIEWERGW